MKKTLQLDTPVTLNTDCTCHIDSTLQWIVRAEFLFMTGCVEDVWNLFNVTILEDANF